MKGQLTLKNILWLLQDKAITSSFFAHGVKTEIKLTSVLLSVVANSSFFVFLFSHTVGSFSQQCQQSET